MKYWSIRNESNDLDERVIRQMLQVLEQRLEMALVEPAAQTVIKIQFGRLEDVPQLEDQFKGDSGILLPGCLKHFDYEIQSSFLHDLEWELKCYFKT